MLQSRRILLRRAPYKRARVSAHDYSFLDYDIVRCTASLTVASAMRCYQPRGAHGSRTSFIRLPVVVPRNAPNGLKSLPVGSLIDTRSNGDALSSADARQRGL